MGNLYNINRLSLFCMVFILTSSFSVLAVGVNTPYWKDRPLKMTSGETREIFFTLQNVHGDGNDARVFVSLIEGQEVARVLSGNEYLVPFGTADSRVVLEISVPEGVDDGTVYPVKFSITSSPDEEDGNIQFSVGYKVDFPVIVAPEGSIPDQPVIVEQPDKGEGNTIVVIIIVSILVLIGIVYWLVKRKR